MNLTIEELAAIAVLVLLFSFVAKVIETTVVAIIREAKKKPERTDKEKNGGDDA